MTTVAYTPLLGLALPSNGSLAGTWGTTVNEAITSLLEAAVAGTTTLSTDADTTLTDTDGEENQSRSAIIKWTASNTVSRDIIAPNRSKVYIIINAGGADVVIKGSGTTGVTVTPTNSTIVAWDGSDFVPVTTSEIKDINGGTF